MTSSPSSTDPVIRAQYRCNFGLSVAIVSRNATYRASKIPDGRSAVCSIPSNTPPNGRRIRRPTPFPACLGLFEHADYHLPHLLFSRMPGREHLVALVRAAQTGDERAFA